MQKILIVEHERDIADLVGFNLEREGYEVMKAYDGITGAEMVIHQRPDLVILDPMLPGKEGYGVSKKIRRNSRNRDIPVIMLTSSAQTGDRFQGLETGAGDYLTKPFSPKELMLRVRAVLRRGDGPPDPVEITYGRFRFDKSALKFYLDRKPVDLTPTEFKLLLFLTERAGKALDRDDLLRAFIRELRHEILSRTLDIHMKRLLQKLGKFLL